VTAAIKSAEAAASVVNVNVNDNTVHSTQRSINCSLPVIKSTRLGEIPIPMSKFVAVLINVTMRMHGCAHERPEC